MQKNKSSILTNEKKVDTINNHIDQLMNLLWGVKLTPKQSQRLLDDVEHIKLMIEGATKGNAK